MERYYRVTNFRLNGDYIDAIPLAAYYVLSGVAARAGILYAARADSLSHEKILKFMESCAAVFASAMAVRQNFQLGSLRVFPTL